jgi:uncharacterized protein
MRCDYCYAGPKFARSMSWDTARRALDFAFAHTAEQAERTQHDPESQLGFFGGEPLLEWNLLKMATEYAVAEAGRIGIRLKRTVTTNMTLLGEEEALWLRENGFHVGLSLDGCAKMHDLVRRTSDGNPSHEICARALDFFRGSDANGEVILVVDPRTVELLAESVAWLIDGNIRRISFSPNFTVAWNPVALAKWKHAYTLIGDLYVGCYRNNRPVNINVFDGKIHARVNNGYRPCDRCGFGENEITVSTTGNFYPCERLVGDDSNAALRIGHVSDGFYSAPRNQFLANRGNVVAECSVCPVRGRCVNWCGCVNYAATGFINRVSGIVCYHERLCIEAADRVGGILFEENIPAFIDTFYLGCHR